MMKQITYSIICCLAACLFTACSEKEAFQEDVPESDRIVLGISSGKPGSRATVADTGAELKVAQLDVFVFENTSNSAGTQKHYERIAVSEGAEKVMLNARRNDFGENTAYWVYIVANSTLAKEDMEKIDSYTTLAAQTQETEQIHMTGIASTSEVPLPQEFLMDGIAYKGTKGTAEPATPGAVVLNSSDTTQETELSVTLRRAAAKIVVNIKQGPLVEFDDSPAAELSAGYYLKSMSYITSLIDLGHTAEAKDLRTTTKTSGEYFKFDGTATPKQITVTAYTYSHHWVDTESTYENETCLIVNIPLTYTKEGETEGEYKENNFYQIPVSETEMLKRNTYYEVTVTVNAPGGEDPTKPIELKDVRYKVAEWSGTIDINVSGDDRPKYLTVNKKEMEMFNMEDDATTLQFTSSSKVSVEITKVYYIDKFGNEAVLEHRGGNTYAEKKTTTGWPPTTTWVNECTISITPDSELSGNIHVESTLPKNNAIRYIELKVTNTDGSEPKTVTIAQYPLEYITNIQGWYSYRDDFGGTHWELLKGQDVIGKTFDRDSRISDWICGCDWSDNNDWSYGETTTGFFGSKVATEKDDGTSTIEYIRWEENRSGGRYTYTVDGSSRDLSSLDNARMYHVRIIASSGDYTVGKPRITDGKTDPGTDNAQLVSPSFMIASQLGATMEPDNMDVAASHCKQYVEVYNDPQTGQTIHLNNWRLPTRAEVEIIMKFQYVENAAMDEVLSGKYYWCADGGTVLNPEKANEEDNQTAIRCIRDAYDDPSTKSAK